MLFTYNIDNDLSENSELMKIFFPNFKASTNVVINNFNTPLQRMVKKNPNILKLMERLDMIEEH